MTQAARWCCADNIYAKSGRRRTPSQGDNLLCTTAVTLARSKEVPKIQRRTTLGKTDGRMMVDSRFDWFHEFLILCAQAFALFTICKVPVDLHFLASWGKSKPPDYFMAISKEDFGKSLRENAWFWFLFMLYTPRNQIGNMLQLQISEVGTFNQRKIREETCECQCFLDMMMCTGHLPALIFGTPRLVRMWKGSRGSAVGDRVSGELDAAALNGSRL